MNKIKQNIYYMNRWNIVREKRKDLELLEKHEERKCLHKFWWIRQVESHFAYQTVYNIFDQIRNKIMQGYKEKLYAKRIIRKIILKTFVT